MNPLNFTSVEVHHLVWEGRLRSFLLGKEELRGDPCIFHKSCPLGRWLCAEGIASFGEVSEVQALIRVHVDLYFIVKRVIEFKDEGQEQAAEEEFKKALAVNHRIMDLVTALEQKLGGTLETFQQRL